MSTKLLTNNYKLHLARQFEESFTEEANTSYYLFLGDHLPKSNVEVQDVDNNERTISIDSYRNMIMGKRLSQQDIALAIRNIPYVSNTVYSMYDDLTINLVDTNFYITVDEGSFRHIYKCLDNNNNSKSIFEPEFSHIIGSNTVTYQTADGYRWKYMYSISSSQYSKFSTPDFIPVFANTDVQAQAVDGAIDVIKVENPGRGYDNYVTGNFSSFDLRIGGDPTLYAISNNVAPAVNGFYTGCILYLAAGSGAGAFRRITDYFVTSNGNQRIIKLSSSLSGADTPSGDTQYEVFPEVRILGDGQQQINAIARALVNSTSSNSISRVEILQRGRGYSFASATVLANSVVQVDRLAHVRPIYSPPGGHGIDPASELGASRISMSVSFSNNESNTILTDNQIQQLGLIENPLFSHVSLNYTNPDGSFEIDEKVIKISPIRINTDAVLEVANTTLICNTAEFETQVKPNDVLYLQSSNGTSHQLVTVVSITDNTEITINTGGLFSCNETKVYHANISSFGVAQEINPTFVKCSNVSGIFATGDLIIGEETGAFAIVDSVSRSGVTKGFDTFIQLFKYNATITSGVFEENEKVFAGSLNNQTANAVIHSIINIGGNDRIIYTSNQIGSFTLTSQITGMTSGATATINSVDNPEIVFDSGRVLYLENVESFTRDPAQSETFKLILSF